MTIRTKRLRIEPISLDDASFVLELVNTEGWIKNIGQRNVNSIADAQKYISEKMITHFESHGYGNNKMIDIKSGEIVGCVSLYNREKVEGVDIGFALLPKFYHQGYAFEGASALLKHGLENLKLKYITGFTTPENRLSQSLLKKLGFSLKNEFIWEETGETLLLYEYKSK